MNALSSFWDVLADDWELFRDGFVNTIYLFVISAIGSLVWGTLLGAMRVSPVPVLRAFGTGYVNVVRNTPLTLVFAFLVFAAPFMEATLPGTFGGSRFFTTAYVALILYTSAFVCEVVRAGVNTVPPGQAEAARAVGMTFTQVLGIVVLPQAMRSMVPPLTSVMIAMLKNTTIAAGFSVAEAGQVVKVFVDRGQAVTPVLLWITIFFLLLILPLVALQRSLERRWAVSR